MSISNFFCEGSNCQLPVWVLQWIYPYCYFWKPFFARVQTAPTVNAHIVTFENLFCQGSNCQLPSGDISYWQGNSWDEGGQSWMGYRWFWKCLEIQSYFFFINIFRDNKTVSRKLTVLKEPSPGVRPHSYSDPLTCSYCATSINSVYYDWNIRVPDIS